MTRHAGGRLVVAAALAGAAWLEPRAQQFRSGIELVRLPVVVTGRDGLLVRGLTAADFVVFEDGVPQTIAAFAEGAPGDGVPLHLGVMLDVSGSMAQDFRQAATAAIQFVNALEEAASVTLVDFDAGIRIGRFGPADYPRLFERIRALKVDGYTALYDAMAAYLRGTAGRGGQHVLLMYTDGGDSVSRLTYTDVLRLYRADSVLVYAIGYLDHQPSSARATQQSRLSSLAAETGGAAFFPSTPKDLTNAYARILDEIASRYTLGYVSTNTQADGRYRRIHVRLTAAEHRTARLRTRPGYIVPAAARAP